MTNLDFLKNYPLDEFYNEKGHVLALAMAMDSRTKLMQESVGTSFKAFIMKIKNNDFLVYAHTPDLVKVSKFILDKILHEPGWIEKVFKEVDKRAAALQKFSRSLVGKDYSTVSNKKLLELYQKFVHHFVTMRIYSSIPTNLEHGTNVFTDHLQEQLSKYLKKDTETFNEVFSVLTSPRKDSYIRQQEISLLQLGLLWGKPKFEEKLEEHTRNFTWMNYTFQGIPVTREEFRAEVQKKVNQKVHFQHELDRIEQDKKDLVRKQEGFIKKYKINPETVRLFSYGQELVYIKYFRKGTFSEAYYSIEFVLNEIARRLRTTVDGTRAMFFDEMEAALLKGKVDLKKIEQRMKDGLLISMDGKTFDLPEEYHQYVLKNIKQKWGGKDIKELKGQTACVGKVTGIVKIINVAQDMQKMRTGDIMVSRSTNPHLVPAMKMAGAIVTDLGGLTCHAAIVSREMKTPCIVGTTIATEVLKDGDEVEVDAYKGVVHKHG